MPLIAAASYARRRGRAETVYVSGASETNENRPAASVVVVADLRRTRARSRGRPRWVEFDLGIEDGSIDCTRRAGQNACRSLEHEREDQQ